MGRGIAQLAAQAGCQVMLHDTNADSLEAGAASIRGQWQRMVEKERIDSSQAGRWSRALALAPGLAQLSTCDLVIEAVIERLDVKQKLLADVERLVRPGTTLATNTSSLSVTAIGSALQRPGNFAGLHFFNPAPLMKVVEVVCGLRTDPDLCTRLAAFTHEMGHQPVLALDTPGFIVNHAGRGYTTEALRIAGEGVADFAAIDRILRDQAGFKLGPFELLDLTGLDVSHPVMESIYHQYYEEPRYRPSVIGAQRVAAGLFGRKSGEGFYRYADGKSQMVDEAPAPDVGRPPPVWVSPRAARRAELVQLLNTLGAEIDGADKPGADALILAAPLGFDVTTVATVDGLDPARTLGIDMLVEDRATRRRVLATNPATRNDYAQAAHGLLARDGKAVSVIQDSAGFVTQRVLGAIVNIAADMCQQRICSPRDLDLAVTLGLGYPMGPLAMGDRYGVSNLLEVLFNMQTMYGDPRYRPSPWLRRRGALGLSLLHVEN
jgi:3-hydroxybutyryl-CoA dehydrogenase